MPWRVPVSDWFSGVTDGGSLKRDNRRLTTEVQRLQNQERDAKTAIEQNETLQALLDLPVLKEVPRVTAARREPFARQLRVDGDVEQRRGVRDITRHAGDGPRGLVGRVLDSWKGGSKVLLLVDPQSNVGVRVQPGLVSGIAEGVAGSDRLRLDLDADAQVAVGDSVVTSGLENSSFPEGLAVGKIVDVQQQPGGLGTVACCVDPWTDFEALTYVTVLRWVPGQGAVVSTTTTTTTTTAPPPADTTPTTGGG